MKHLILIIGISISISLFGQTLTKKELRYKPKNFDESLTQLDKILPDSSKAKIRLMTEIEFLQQTHFSTGMWIRNEWLYDRYLLGLIVTKSDLRKDLVAKKLISNDDMSSVILRSYYRKLNGKDIQFDKQIQDIHQWYINMNNPKWRAQQDSISWSKYMSRFAIGDTLTNHVYYDRDWLGNPRKNTLIVAKVIDKSSTKLKIDIVSFGSESNKTLIYSEIDCNLNECWISPNNSWRKKNDEKE